MAIALLALAAGPLVAARAAVAQTRTGAQADDNITVEADRMICRRITRSTTRIGPGRVCRTESEWRAGRGAATAHEYDTIEEAAQALEIYAQKVSPGGSTPLGPR